MPTTLRLLFVLSVAWSAAPVAAQCTTIWSSGAPKPELSGTASCSTLWDPDGAGPAPQRLVVGGWSLIGGAEAASHRIMTWDGSQWQSLGSGPGTSGLVSKLTTWNGRLVAAGDFTGDGLDRIAMWDGVTWQPLGPGLPIAAAALAVWNGQLVAGWNFGGPVIELWNGAVWSSLPRPPTLSSLNAIVSFQGQLCVGGVGSTAASGALERWNGTSWLPTIPANGIIRTLGVRTVSPTISTLYAGGSFTSIGGASIGFIASTSGGTSFPWLAVGGNLPGCLELHVRASGFGTAVVVSTGAAATPVMQLSGSSFVAMGNSAVTSLAYYGGSYHGTAIGSAACLRYDGSAWVPVLGQSLTGEVRALTPSGADMIVGGTIGSTIGLSLNGIARWNGTTFQPLGTGMGGTSVDALSTLDNGDIVAGGSFSSAGGTSVGNIARWDGSAWAALGSGCDQQVLALCKLPNGNVVAGGRFANAGGVACARIARWNGSTWAPLGSGMDNDVLALAVRGDGTLFAGGAFTTAGGVACSRIAQWNGSSWQPVGLGCNGNVHALAVRPNGDVVAVGSFSAAGGLSADRCARWTGSAWAAMAASSGDVVAARAVCALPNGDVVAGRGFHQPAVSPDSGISRWNGSTWSGFDSGLAMAAAGTPVFVRALAQRADGALIVGGDFAFANGLVARGLAKLSPTCPASVSPYGAGCSSAAGPLVLATDTLPWLGSTFRTTTTGIAPASLCLGVIGFSRLSIPLSSLLGQGQPGCLLLTSLDITFLLTNGPGTARSALTLPDSASLLGATFHQQTLPFEIDGTGTLVAVRGSNALAATIGTL
jgi:hypothetical protein